LALALADEPMGTGSIELPAFAIQNGNVAHVAFEFDYKRIYYVGGLLDAAAVPSAPKTALEAQGQRRRVGEPVVGAGVDGSGLHEASGGAGDSAIDGVSGEDGGRDVDAGGATSEAEADPSTTAGEQAFRDVRWSSDGRRGWLVWVGPMLSLIVVAGAAWRHRATR